MLHSIGTKPLNVAHPVVYARVTTPGYALCGGGAVTHFTYWDKGSYLWDLELTEESENTTSKDWLEESKIITEQGDLPQLRLMLWESNYTRHDPKLS